MSKRADLIGKKFGRLSVMAFAGHSRSGKALWLCHCDCGNTSTPLTNSLRGRSVQSCGCLQKEAISKIRRSHGKSHSREYFCYINAKQRCLNSNNPNWKYYGGRNIQFKFRTFEEFYNALGPSPSRNSTVDRINNNGHYEIGNIRWANRRQQAENRRHLSFEAASNRSLQGWKTRRAA